jgi:hypothetical protein
MTKTKKRAPVEGITVRGAYKLQIIDPDGTVAGEAEGTNAIVTQGLTNYLCARLIGAGSSVTHIGIGTGAAPISSNTSLPGELGGGTNRVAIGGTATGATGSSAIVSMATSFASGTAAFTGNIANIGLFGHSSSASALFAGATYASSPLSSNQAVQVSYTVSFVAS